MTAITRCMRRMTRSVSCCKVICCMTEVEDDAEAIENESSENISSDTIIITAPSTKIETKQSYAILQALEKELQIQTSNKASKSCNSFQNEIFNETSVTKIKSSNDCVKISDKECHNSQDNVSSDLDSKESSSSNFSNIKQVSFEEFTSDFTTSEESVSEMKCDNNALFKATDRVEHTYQSIQESSEYESESHVSSEIEISNTSSSNPSSIEHDRFEESSSDFATSKESDINSDDSVVSQDNHSEHLGHSPNETQDTIASEIGASGEALIIPVKTVENGDAKSSSDAIQNSQDILSPDNMHNESSLRDQSIDEEDAFHIPNASISYLNAEDFEVISKDSEDDLSNSKDQTITNEELQVPALDVIDMLMYEIEPENPFKQREFELVRYMEGIYQWKTIRHDMVAIIEDQVFKCHKEILTAQSEYFRGSFISRSKAQPVWRIDTDIVTAQVFQTILTFIYEDHMELNCQQIKDVHSAATHLQIQSVTERCLQMIDTSSKQLDNFVNQYAFSYQQEHMQSEKAHALKTLSLNFEAAVFANGYLHLNVNQIVELISQDELGTRSEVVIFLAALKWVDFDFIEREEHVEKVLGCVRFDQMSEEELIACHAPPLLPGLVKMQQVKDQMHDALCFVVAKSHGIEKGFKNVQTKPRKLLLKEQPLNLWDLTGYEDYILQNAAITIQSAFRSYLSRKKITESDSSEMREWVKYRSMYRSLRQEFEQRVGQHMSEMRDNESTVIKTANKHYRETLKDLFQMKRISAESLE